MGFQDDKCPFQEAAEEVLHLFEVVNKFVLTPLRKYMVLSHTLELYQSANKDNITEIDVQVEDAVINASFLSKYSTCLLLAGKQDANTNAITFHYQIQHYFGNLELQDKTVKGYKIAKLSEIFDDFLVAFNVVKPMLVSNSMHNNNAVPNKPMFIVLEKNSKKKNNMHKNI